MVLSVYGDVVLKAGKDATTDLTTLGSLAASVLAASEGLGSLLRCKANPIQMGLGKTCFWFERLNTHWILVGTKCPFNESAVKKMKSPLAKGLNQSAKASEALDGLEIGSIDTQLSERMK